MPKRTDLSSILLIGSGPIVIGQACEFDYSGTQAVKALRQEGYRVCLVNSNPATIMTDPELADRTYIEPLTVEVLEQVIAREKPSALLPTLGGQTALNLAIALAKQGILKKYGVELIGASVEAIEKAEDRQLFKAAMAKIGLKVPSSAYVRSLAEAHAALPGIGFPAIIRPSFTLGGAGASIAYNADEFDGLIEWGLQQSPRHEILLEQSVLGWKEYELEVMRDSKDNVVIICSIENLDPMGIHTGDSITIAPAMTLTDKEYQRLRNASAAVIREIGVATGGSNIQFAVNPENGDFVVIEMNPRVSRSSALASKATGFPIAKIAAKLAVGYTLDEIPNDITKETPASFEPTIDYVVVKMPRFAFEKFPGADTSLTTQMKSVGEAMSIGRTFQEALGKAIRSLEIDRWGFDLPIGDGGGKDLGELRRKIATPGPFRLFELAEAIRRGLSLEEAFALTKIDPWFLRQIGDLVAREEKIRKNGLGTAAELASHKAAGMSDRRLATLTGKSEEDVRQTRLKANLRPRFRQVDTCAAEFEAKTPYLYSAYETGDDHEAPPSPSKKIVVLGGGPNRIGQGIEFDYCCVHAALALAEEGFETLMVNCNPETVSTDYDISSRLFFEPLTREDVLAICDREKPLGVIVQFGGQTPLRLAVPLEKAGVKLLGTPADAIDRAEDRERFGALLEHLKLQAPPWGTARSVAEALAVSKRLGYPVVVRPSYVLGGRAMEIVYDDAALQSYMSRAVDVSPEHPVLIDRFLNDATEVDVDALSDGKDVFIGGVMEHIEEAGIHSGDSACALPPYSLAPAIIENIRAQTSALAKELGVIGLMNIQFAVQRDKIYILEVNPRGSRTVPYVSKATGIPLAKMAARVMVGRKIADLGLMERKLDHVAVKEAVFPFVKFPGVDTILGPEMRSTGEVMGIAPDFATAFAKSQLAAGTKLPTEGTIFLSVRDADKEAALEVAQTLIKAGFALVATRGTATFLAERGIAVKKINKVVEGRPDCVDAIKNGGIQLVINTVFGAQETRDSFSIRRTALMREIPYFTTMAAARAAAGALLAKGRGHGQPAEVRSIQEYNTWTKNSR